MTNRFSNIISRYKIVTAFYAGGDYFFDVLRPNYNVVDNTPTTVATNCKFYVEPTEPKFAIDKFREAEEFLVCGDPDLIQPGDILKLVGSNDFPPLTIMQVPEEHEFLSIKTGKVGRILDGQNEVYSNIYFDYSVSIIPGKEEYPGVSTSFTLPLKKAVIYTRPNLIEGMVLQNQTPGQPNTVWNIKLVDYKVNMVVLHIEGPDRG